MASTLSNSGTRLAFIRHLRHEDPLAYRDGSPISVRQFLADVYTLAGLLPDGRYLLNGCVDRYRFTVALAAALLRDQISVLPHNHLAQTLERLGTQFPGLYCVTDRDLIDRNEPLASLIRVRYPLAAAALGHYEIPSFAADQMAAYLFTSGSTGDPVVHARTWGSIVRSALVEADRLGMGEGTPYAILGTVPAQHSYGFESTVHLALQGRGALVAERPFYPVDVLEALDRLPRPRMLVTTPVHLRAMLGTGRHVVPADLVLSATAPLSIELARAAEIRFGAPLLEIYGSTESGQVASRRPTVGEQWQVLDGVALSIEGGQPFASGGHVEQRIALSDVIELAGPQHFLLHGRSADMVNIAGKRSSLAFLEGQLNSIDGVVDCAFLVADDRVESTVRVTAFVVAPTLSAGDILAALRARIEPVFLPRPLHRVESLPRDDTGKLPRDRLEALALRLSAARADRGS